MWYALIRWRTRPSQGSQPCMICIHHNHQRRGCIQRSRHPVGNGIFHSRHLRRSMSECPTCKNVVCQEWRCGSHCNFVERGPGRVDSRRWHRQHLQCRRGLSGTCHGRKFVVDGIGSLLEFQVAPSLYPGLPHEAMNYFYFHCMGMESLGEHLRSLC